MGKRCVMHGDDLTRSELNDKTSRIIKAALKVHTALGPGLLESAYQQCVAHELRKRGFTVIEQHPIPLIYEELRVEVAYRAEI
jgi:GxxExxY protein